MKVFREKAPWLMHKLMGDFRISKLDAAAIAGNSGHESGGFTNLQEDRPTVKGSRGGYGWFQWTGPRRKAYEAYCARNNLNSASDEANYAWLWIELRGSEKKALDALRTAPTLKDKVIAFERSFERAGVKHYPSRIKYAEIALEAFDASIYARGDVAPPPLEPQTKETEEMVAPAIAPILISILPELIKIINQKKDEDKTPMPTPVSLPPPPADPVKSPAKSLTIGSGVVGFLGSVLGVYTAYKSGNMEALGAALTTAFAALGAIIGRFKADTRIG
jgi:hypothetical protein